MAAVLNNITAGVISLDSSSRIGTVNHAAESMLGVDAGEIVGKSPLQLLHGEHAEIITEMLGQMELSPSSQWQRQISLVVDGRDVKLLVNVVTLRTESGRHSGLVAVFEDITELEKMQRLAAWREVAKRIAHEIKNPLTPIKLSAQRFAAQIRRANRRTRVRRVHGAHRAPGGAHAAHGFRVLGLCQAARGHAPA